MTARIDFFLWGRYLHDSVRPVLLAIVWCAILKHWRDGDVLHAQDQAAEDAKKRWDDYEWFALRILASLGTGEYGSILCSTLPWLIGVKLTRFFTPPLSRWCGAVTGMLLAFRSNSAMDRWNTGRHKWAEVQATSRSLVRLLSTSLPSPRATSDEPENAQARLECQREVEEVLALVPFFNVALMYQLRGEPILPRSGFAIGEAILIHLPPQLLKAFCIINDLPARDLPSEEKDMGGAANKSAEIRRGFAMLNTDRPETLRKRSQPLRDGCDRIVTAHCALATLMHLQSKLDRFHAEGQSQPAASSTRPRPPLPKLTGPIYAHCIGLLNSLSSQMAELERVRDTPIPLSLSQRFSQLLLINTLLLPIVLVNRLSQHWHLCVVATWIVTAMLYGIDSVSATLSQPFGRDQEDLPLPRWCMDFEREWHEMRQAAQDTQDTQSPSTTTVVATKVEAGTEAATAAAGEQYVVDEKQGSALAQPPISSA
ncbi:hypothetical protein ACQY0O_001646 [Thecaphora frezii]